MKNVSFGDLFEFQKKSTIKAGDGLPLNQGTYPLYTSSNSLKKSYNEFLFDDRSLIFGTGGSASVHYCNERFAVSTDCFVVKAIKEEELCLKYIYYFLKGNIHILENGFKGAGLKHISKRYISEIPLPIPPLEEQKKIAAILDAADGYRQKTKALTSKYDQLTQSLFLDMFGDPVTNPKGWKVVRFDQLVSEECPLTYGIVQPGDEVENGTPCVRPVDLKTQYVDSFDLKRIDPEISLKFKRTILKGGEILLSVRGSVGVISIAALSLKNTNVTRGIVPIWFDENLANKLFFYFLYKTNSIQRRLAELSKGATLIQLNLKDLREFPLIKPSLELQNLFAERVEQIEKQKQQAEASLVKAEELFSSLLQRAFKGELTS